MKSVVISGASAGIGAACAEVFVKKGYQVFAGARRLDKLRSLAALDGDILFHSLDVCDQDSVDAFAAFVCEHSGKAPDVVINNAGMAAGVDHIAKGQAKDWQQMLDTNIMGLLRFSKAFLPSMIEQNTGHIINLSSIAAYQSYAGGAVYAGSKHAVKAIGEALRMELNGTNIRVSAVSPGMVETEFSEVRLGDKQKAKDVYRGLTPLTAGDIAECVYFAASRPPHVNIDDIIVMPVAQANVHKVHRES